LLDLLDFGGAAFSMESVTWRHNSSLQVHEQTQSKPRANQSKQYRVAKTHRMP